MMRELEDLRGRDRKFASSSALAVMLSCMVGDLTLKTPYDTAPCAQGAKELYSAIAVI